MVLAEDVYICWLCTRSRDLPVLCHRYEKCHGGLITDRSSPVVRRSLTHRQSSQFTGEFICGFAAIDAHRSNTALRCMAELKNFILRHEAIKLYRTFLKSIREAPVESRG